MKKRNLFLFLNLLLIILLLSFVYAEKEVNGSGETSSNATKPEINDSSGNDSFGKGEITESGEYSYNITKPESQENNQEKGAVSESGQISYAPNCSEIRDECLNGRKIACDKYQFNCNENFEIPEGLEISEEGAYFHGSNVTISPSEAEESIRKEVIESGQIILTEEQERIFYEIKARTEGRFLNLINMEYNVKYRINAENASIEGIRGPWWGFLVHRRTLEDYNLDFNCDNVLNLTDVNIISDIWRNETTIDVHLVTSKGAECRNLGEYLGYFWKRGIRKLPDTEIIRITNKIMGESGEENGENQGCENGACENQNYTFGKILSNGNPKQRLNFMFIASNFSKEEEQRFLTLINETLFGTPDGDSPPALFRDYLYKNEIDKFNVYYYIKYGQDYGGRDELLLDSKTGYSNAYEKVYNDLSNLKDNGVEIKEEIDYLIVFSNRMERSSTMFWPNCSFTSNCDDLIARTSIVLLFVPEGTGNIGLTLAHELGHRIGYFADEYYEEAKGTYIPILSRGINVDSIGCPKWCSGQINQTCNELYTHYLSCISSFHSPEDNSQLIDCYNKQIRETRLTECNFGIGCTLDTGCFWPMQGTLGFKPYYNGIMNNGQNYGQWGEKIIKDNLADISKIKPIIQRINITLNSTFSYTYLDGDTIRDYTFAIPFKLYPDNSQTPFVFLINGRNYKISFEVNTSLIRIDSPIDTASLCFNQDKDGYLAYFVLSKSAKDGFEILDSDKFPVNLKLKYDHVQTEKKFIINLKYGRVE